MISNFGTRYGEQETVYSNPGSDVATVYSARYDSDGRLLLEPVGEKNIFNEIQSHRDEVDLQRILERYNAGETDVLSRVQGFYGDITQMPTSYPEFFNLMMRSREFYDGLPVEIKQKYGNSFESFIAASQRPDFLDSFKMSARPNVSSPVKENPTDES